MHAAVGDRMVVVSGRLQGPVRDGEILSVGTGEGGAPYLVRWSDTGRETLFFPGPDAHVEHFAHDDHESGGPVERPAGSAAARPSGTSHTKRWQIDVYLYENPDSTSASVVLHSDVPTALTGRGEAHRRPGDHDVPEIGDEVAVARALRRLADRLLGSAGDDLAGVEGHPVQLTL